MDAEQLCAVVDAIPPGRWMSYGDVCAAAGGEPRQALGINQRLTRPGAEGRAPGAEGRRGDRADGAGRSRRRAAQAAARGSDVHRLAGERGAAARAR